MSATTAHTPPPPTPRTARTRRTAAAERSWALLALLAVAQFMVVLDVTVVNVALPSIADALALGAGSLSWVITAYVLFTGGLMLLGGRLADLARSSHGLPRRARPVHRRVAGERARVVGAAR